MKAWTRRLFWSSLLACGCGAPATSPTTASRTPDVGSHKADAPAANPAAPHSGFIFVGCGFLYVDNDGPVPYTVLLPATDAKRVPDGSAFVLDGVLVEVTTTSAEQIGKPGLRGADLLHAHAAWETEHIRQAKGWKELAVAPGSEQIFSEQPSAIMMLWGLDLPEPIEVKGVKVDRLAFVTAAIDSSILVLGAPLPAQEDVDAHAKKLGAIMHSLQTSTTPVDVVALGEEVRRSPPWRGCPTSTPEPTR